MFAGIDAALILATRPRSCAPRRRRATGTNTIPALRIEQSRGFLEGMVASQGITQEGVLAKVKEYVTIADDKVDLAAAALDLGTNTFEHTGIQTVARRVISRAYGEI